MMRPLRVGLTGGVASGKSSVSSLFAALGVALIDADVIAREVVAPGTALLQQVFELFGADLKQVDGSLNRAALRRRVFADDGQRRQLEALLHPAIRQRSEQLTAQAQGAYVIHVIPLLVESKASSLYDRVLVVDCPESQQLARLQSRDGIDLQQAQAMLAAQVSRTVRLAAATDVILNDKELANLGPQVHALDQIYRKLAAQRPSPA